MSIDKGRIEAFKSALLNTCVRIHNEVSPEHQLTLVNCKSDKDFCKGAFLCLDLPFFQPAIETAMAFAITDLRNDLFKLSR
jgi:hypothetical protein